MKLFLKNPTTTSTFDLQAEINVSKKSSTDFL